VDKNWAVLGRFFQSLHVPCGDKQGRVGRSGQPLRRAGRGAISIKEILGKNQGPTSNQTKIQFKKKIIFIIEHIKKTRIF